MLKNFNLENIYQIHLIILAFLMPLTVFGANLIIVSICLIWIFSGNYKLKFQEIFQSKVLIASIVFYSIHIIGLLWSQDLAQGLIMLHKMWYFILLFPILFTLTKKEYISHYVFSFLLAILLSVVLSFSVWFEMIAPFKNATLENPTPFMSHISYNPILALAIYIGSHNILFNSKITSLTKYFYGCMVLLMSVNMFVTGGRAGQVMFFAMLAILIFQYSNFKKFTSLLVIITVSGTIFFSAYQFSPIFKTGVDAAIETVQDYESKKGTSVGLRITFVINSWEIIKSNPVLGVGTGGFRSEYYKINQINTPTLPNTTNPHNMYIWILTQLGFTGLISFLMIFYYQIKSHHRSSNRFVRDFGLALPILFLIIMFSDSYLLGHYTSLVYIFFSSFLYKNFEEN
jgi:O-antigen ligase